MQVHSLYCYPVKSLSGIKVEQLDLDDFGPVADRRWMITDPEGSFISQRSHPQLARIAVSLDARKVTVTIPDQGDFLLEQSPERLNVRVWRDSVSALRAVPGPAEAISRFLGEAVDLVYMPLDSFRSVDRVAERRVSFSDGFPFLITSQASLEELNSRLDVAVDMRRFRPNIVVSGAPAWAEDGWQSLAIGSTRLDLVKPCSRCILTTVDPDLGSRNPDQQPLRTLGGYRRRAEGVMFGVNAVHTGTGPITIGQSISLI
ncbi:MOSC domain-containing protein [Marinobacter sp.]|uniref:MOSC domain-containing protein n=1 Tax=Marinobacter sp. TaxID=50741 RepID=UPI00384C6BDF